MSLHRMGRADLFIPCESSWLQRYFLMSFVTKTVVKDLPKQGLWTLGAFHVCKGVTLVCGKFEAKILDRGLNSQNQGTLVDNMMLIDQIMWENWF